ncbi:hypothetical protein [Stakelama marina]|uniref:Uncharacterized protein n=1 Tax=Stakelama marina TaxID=2826939 RepID=A0A8T4IER7_9SPHN|nr:hypothetical protein [Stakelama marina]MBR0551515.1 hypothetical protein [Stakelama marina]
MMAYASPHRTVRSGAPLAALAAGPVTMCILGLGHLATSNDTVAVTPQGVIMAASSVLMLTIPATIVALLPVWFGTQLMLWAGKHLEIARLPVMWGLVGAALLAGPAALVAGDTASSGFACGAIGAICALICRIGATWPAPQTRHNQRSAVNRAAIPQVISATPPK